MPGLRVDLEADQLPGPRRPVVVSEIRSTDPATAQSLMGPQRQHPYILVNIW